MKTKFKFQIKDRKRSRTLNTKKYLKNYQSEFHEVKMFKALITATVAEIVFVSSYNAFFLFSNDRIQTFLPDRQWDRFPDSLFWKLLQ